MKKTKYKKVFSMGLHTGVRNYTVKDLISLKGKKKLTQINVTNVEEAAACEEAGIDLIIAGPPSPLKEIREAAPKTFFTVGINWLEHSNKESAIKQALQYMELGIDSIHCGCWNINFIKYLNEFRIPFQGHVGFVPMRSTWTGGMKPFGKTSEEAKKILNDIKELENLGAWGVEVECIPEKIMKEIDTNTKLITISIGSGKDADVQFLFAEDILGNSNWRTPRHAKVYRNFNKVFSNIQKERVKAFKEYKVDVASNNFPSKEYIIDVDKEEILKFKKYIKNSK